MIFLILLAFFQENLIPEKFKEPSGLTYSQERGTIFVVGDEGHIAELDKNGKLLKMKKMAGDSCERDFEAIGRCGCFVLRNYYYHDSSFSPDFFFPVGRIRRFTVHRRCRKRFERRILFVHGSRYNNVIDDNNTL